MKKIERLENKKYRIEALFSCAHALKQKLYDPLWTDIFGSEGTEEDILQLKIEINKMIGDMWKEYNKLKYDLDSTYFQVWPIYCAECEKLLYLDNDWNFLRIENINKAMKDGHAFIEHAFYCAACSVKKWETSTGLCGKKDPYLAHNLWSVTCSNLRCGRLTVLAEFEKKQDAIKTAEQKGYCKINDKWYCPECSKGATYEKN